jgi:glucose-1-phosphate cytidylyltransferase
MKVLILCGGRGVRSLPFTDYLPKPMMPIGGTPIVVHVIRSFIHQGFTRFVLSAGYRQAALHDYFEGKQFDAEIEIIDTGVDADTGDRILRCRDRLTERFIATYSDGLCDVPLDRLQDFHAAHGGLASVTCVPLRSQYGVLQLSANGQVEEIREKPLMPGYWINAGFIMLEPRVFDYWEGQSLEREVLPNLAARKQLFGYRHDGFFKSVDSYKDVVEFEDMMETGARPWISPALHFVPR